MKDDRARRKYPLLNNLSTPCTLWSIAAMPLSSNQGRLETTAKLGQMVHGDALLQY